MLKIIGLALGAFFLLIVGFVIWRYTSVKRGMRQRDDKLIQELEPLGRKIEKGTVTPAEIAALAARPELRFMLFTMLRGMDRPDLLPSGYSSPIQQGESALAFWMMHPNELQAAPEAIELIETLKRNYNGAEAEFHVYRYKMSPGHWATKNGWMLGLAGPVDDTEEPYTSAASAFSRVGDIHGQMQPAELVDWYIGMLRQKGMIT